MESDFSPTSFMNKLDLFPRSLSTQRKEVGPLPGHFSNFWQGGGQIKYRGKSRIGFSPTGT
jgi:hypothetical protein